MTDKARELLKKALRHWDDCEDISDSYLVSNVMEEIREYLADTNPSETINSQEVDRSERVALSKEELLKQWSVAFQYGHVDKATFIYGVRFAERHHGIGGGDE